MTLDNGGHLDSDAGSIVEVLQHVLALGVLQQRAGVPVQGEPAGPSIRVRVKGSLSPACGDSNQVNNDWFAQITDLCQVGKTKTSCISKESLDFQMKEHSFTSSSVVALQDIKASRFWENTFISENST